MKLCFGTAYTPVPEGLVLADSDKTLICWKFDKMFQHSFNLVKDRQIRWIMRDLKDLMTS